MKTCFAELWLPTTTAKILKILNYCSIQLTILHHNENCQRNIKHKVDGTPMVVVHRSKATKLDPRAVYRREEASYGKYTG